MLRKLLPIALGALSVVLAGCGLTGPAATTSPLAYPNEPAGNNLPQPLQTLQARSLAYPNPSETVLTPGVPPIVPSGRVDTIGASWTASSYVLESGTTVTDAQAQALLDKPLQITTTALTFDGQTCQSLNLQSETVRTADFVPASWRTSGEVLGIDDEEILVLRTNCSVPGFGEYVRLQDDRLVVKMPGVFVFFTPAPAH